MTPTETPENHLRELITGYENDSLSREDEEHLIYLLGHEPLARRLFLEHFEYSAFFRQEARNRRLFSPGVRAQSEKISRIRRRVNASVLAAAACLLLLGLAFFLIQIKKPPLAVAFRSAPGSHFTVMDADGRVLKDLPDQFQEVGSVVEVSQGTLELIDQAGVRSILNGPAKLEFTKAGEMRLHYGTIYCDMEDAESGACVVLTDHLRVVDLGTAFAITSPQDATRGVEEVHVVEGTVEITLVSSREVLVAEAGQSYRLSQLGMQAELKPVPSRKEAFISHLPDSLPFIHWSFDDAEGESFPASGPLCGNTSYPLTWKNLRTESDFSMARGPGKFGQALILNGLGDYGSTEWPGISGRAPRSISVWVKIPQAPLSDPAATRQDTARRNVVSWGIRAWSPEGGSWEIDFPYHQNNPEQILATKYGQGYGDIRTRKTLDDGQWHHIVSIFDGSLRKDGAPNVVHYLDGEMVESFHQPTGTEEALEVGTLTHLPISQPLRLGIAAAPLTENLPTFAVAIDELRVFAGVLDRKQVEQLYTANHFTSDPMGK
ncbi:MAG: LamG-like jellyroll fold domain-containing protein [Verrucomicrobiales bacterium]